MRSRAGRLGNDGRLAGGSFAAMARPLRDLHAKTSGRLSCHKSSSEASEKFQQPTYDAKEVEHRLPAEVLDQRRRDEQAQQAADVQAAEDEADGTGALVLGNHARDHVCGAARRNALAQAHQRA